MHFILVEDLDRDLELVAHLLLGMSNVIVGNRNRTIHLLDKVHSVVSELTKNFSIVLFTSISRGNNHIVVSYK